MDYKYIDELIASALSIEGLLRVLKERPEETEAIVTTLRHVDFINQSLNEWLDSQYGGAYIVSADDNTEAIPEAAEEEKDTLSEDEIAGEATKILGNSCPSNEIQSHKGLVEKICTQESEFDDNKEEHSECQSADQFAENSESHGINPLEGVFHEQGIETSNAGDSETVVDVHNIDENTKDGTAKEYTEENCDGRFEIEDSVDGLKTQDAPATEDATENHVAFEFKDDSPVKAPVENFAQEMVIEDNPFDSRGTLRVDEMLTRKSARNLRSSFTLNDKFRFRRELFKSDDKLFARTLDDIDAMATEKEAYEYITRLGWDMDDEKVKDFMSIVSMHFAGL